MCLAIGVKGLGPKTATIAMCMLAGLFVGVEFHSLLNVAIPHWTGGVYWSEALSRLTLVHPSFLAPPYFLPLYAVSTGVLVLAVLLEHPGRLWADI